MTFLSLHFVAHAKISCNCGNVPSICTDELTQEKCDWSKFENKIQCPRCRKWFEARELRAVVTAANNGVRK